MSGKSGEPDPSKIKNKKISESSLGSLSESSSSSDPSLISQLENNKNIIDPKDIEDNSNSKSSSIISPDSDHSIVIPHQNDEKLKLDDDEEFQNLSAIPHSFPEDDENSDLSFINDIKSNEINSSSKGNSKKFTGKKRRHDSDLSKDNDDFN